MDDDSTNQETLEDGLPALGPLELLLVVLSPVMAVVALLIRPDGPGPVLLRQKRVGENGRIFTMYKFRTMVPDADASKA